jgi:hypothetical protein
MEGMSTGLRAFFTRHVDPKTVYSYALLLGLVTAVVVMGAMIVASQLKGM